MSDKFGKTFDHLVRDIWHYTTKCFGEDVQFLPKAGGCFDVRGIFSEQFTQVSLETEQLIASNQPHVGVDLTLFPFTPKKGDKMRIRNRLYRIKDVQEDSEDAGKIFLHEVLE